MSTFHNCARRAVNPALPMRTRLAGLGSCLLKLGMTTGGGPELPARRRALLDHFNRRFELSAGPSPEQVVAAVAVAQAEYGKLREVERVLYRRRVAWKSRGCRSASRSEREMAALLWGQAVERFMAALGQ